MPRERDDPSRDAAWLLDILTAARAIQSFVAGHTFEKYEKNHLVRSAGERQVEIFRREAMRSGERWTHLAYFLDYGRNGWLMRRRTWICMAMAGLAILSIVIISWRSDVRHVREGILLQYYQWQCLQEPLKNP